MTAAFPTTAIGLAGAATVESQQQVVPHLALAHA
jgi:hypothetical protein